MKTIRVWEDKLKIFFSLQKKKKKFNKQVKRAAKQIKLLEEQIARLKKKTSKNLE